MTYQVQESLSFLGLEVGNMPDLRQTASQMNLLFDDEETIWLPDLWSQAIRTQCGYVSCLLLNSGPRRITSHSTLLVSKRRNEQVVELQEGQRVLLTEYKSCPEIVDVDGILCTNQGRPEKAYWLDHKMTKEFTRSWASSPTTARDAIRASWLGRFQYAYEVKDASGKIVRPGLRLPQIGALHAIGAHWSLSNEVATVVMPTGTGKTETMLSALVAHQCKCMLVVVPSVALSDQTAKKFMRLGILRSTKNIDDSLQNPIVGVLRRRPRELEDLDIFDQCNVVVATIGTIAQGDSAHFAQEIAARCSHLVLDEAHHVAAKTWSEFRKHFSGKPVLQFTATPFREDGQPVDGKIIYNYPLARAQQDGYFKRISFEAVFEPDSDSADFKIAERAVRKITQDLKDGFNHVLMARCNGKKRAETIYKIYRKLAPQLSPVLIHSKSESVKDRIEDLRQGRSHIVVCVNMLAEGFDLPQLKIAAVHDKHKSLGVLLQFAGRFTRTAGENIGDAHIIANTGLQDVTDALDKLYNEDADWNALLANFSFSVIQQQRQLIDFLRESKSLFPDDDQQSSRRIALKSLLPKHSAIIYEADRFNPQVFNGGLDKGLRVENAWINDQQKALIFVTRSSERIVWTKSESIADRIWNLFVVHYNADLRLLFIHSSLSGTLHQDLAKAVSEGTARLIDGETVFRSLGRMKRLVFQQVGLKKHGRRNLRYSMYTGSDVVDALSPAQRENSTRSNVFGVGYENGTPTTVGCSRKGKIWARNQGPVESLVKWCAQIGEKLRDDSIKTDAIIENVLIPSKVDQIPDAIVLHILWPHELHLFPEERINFVNGDERIPFYISELQFFELSSDRTSLTFNVVAENASGTYRLVLSGQNGYHFQFVNGISFDISIGAKTISLLDYFNDFPPEILFVDGSELHGCDHFPLKEPGADFPIQQLHPRSWDDVDITCESIWSGDKHRPESIQARVSDLCSESNYDIVFNDDGSNEAADLVCLKEEDDFISLLLVHCKYSSESTPGARIKDVVEVASQVTKSVKWFWKFERLCKHIRHREGRKLKFSGRTRFIKGDIKVLKRLEALSRYKPIKGEVIAVQPGVSIAKVTREQLSVLGAAESYLRDTANLQLNVWCSH